MNSDIVSRATNCSVPCETRCEALTEICSVPRPRSASAFERLLLALCAAGVSTDGDDVAAKAGNGSIKIGVSTEQAVRTALWRATDAWLIDVHNPPNDDLVKRLAKTHIPAGKEKQSYTKDIFYLNAAAKHFSGDSIFAMSECPDNMMIEPIPCQVRNENSCEHMLIR
ncbi:hypothetical protein K2X14_10725 [Acetobacter sp. TBRC 12305]|uniref:Uncharacterized protein n=1 Tax=Acetobacter garciniae TaxID=2817435 RepID=A0A939HQ85_9PROT|nr:hypothetical protein [Acetobacter garciniae]MBO1325519.1 hypothetical protein [Acetobacter garciniae]MBX0345309.1 hypothetical protein [Acetobacter garciniae]